MAFNVNELVLDKVRSLTAHNLTDGEMLFRLTSLEDPSLSCTAEGEEVVDAIGALITTLYRAKKATFSASNSLISLDLAAAQYGTNKEVGSSTSMIEVPTYEVLTVDKGKVSLKKIPTQKTVKIDDADTTVYDIGYIYTLERNEIGTSYAQDYTATAADASNFLISEVKETVDGEEVVTGVTITVPTSVADGSKIYVDYKYKTENANRIANKTSNFPESCSMKIYAYFRDKCNDNLIYSGIIVSPKAKLNPEQVELALTSTGKHAFEFTMMRDYCDEDAELFSIIVAE